MLNLLPGPRFVTNQTYNVRAALFDIDNTLVGNESPELPSKRFKRAAMAGRGKISVAVATARPLSKVSHILAYIGSDGLSILSNGAQIYDGRAKKMVAEWAIPLETCNRLTKKLQASSLIYWINDDGVDYFPRVTASGDATQYERQRDIWDKGSEMLLIADYKPAKPFVIVISNATKSQVEVVETIVRECNDPEITSFIAHQIKQLDGTFLHDIFIVNRHANKRDALHEVLRRQRLAPEDMLVVGDGRNDAVIVEAAGVGVAVDNAVDETKRVATFIAPSREEDGAAITLEYFLDRA